MTLNSLCTNYNNIKIIDLIKGMKMNIECVQLEFWKDLSGGKFTDPYPVKKAVFSLRAKTFNERQSFPALHFMLVYCCLCYSEQLQMVMCCLSPRPPCARPYLQMEFGNWVERIPGTRKITRVSSSECWCKQQFPMVWHCLHQESMVSQIFFNYFTCSSWLSGYVPPSIYVKLPIDVLPTFLPICF